MVHLHDVGLGDVEGLGQLGGAGIEAQGLEALSFLVEVVEELNAILHTYSSYIIGRMGLPYRQKNVNIICVAVDAPQDIISAMSGKLGLLAGVNAKTAYSNVIAKE